MAVEGPAKKQKLTDVLFESGKDFEGKLLQISNQKWRGKPCKEVFRQFSEKREAIQSTDYQCFTLKGIKDCITDDVIDMSIPVEVEVQKEDGNTMRQFNVFCEESMGTMKSEIMFRLGLKDPDQWDFFVEGRRIDFPAQSQSDGVRHETFGDFMNGNLDSLTPNADALQKVRLRFAKVSA